jgi:competence protein ComEC
VQSVLHKEIPFLRLGLPLCAGIITGLWFTPGLLFLLVFAFLIVTGFSVSFFFNRFHNNLLFGITLSVTLFVSGILLYNNEKKRLTILKSQETTFICTLSDYPEEKASSLMLTTRLSGKFNSSGTEPIRGSMVMYLKKDKVTTELRPGDKMLIRCTPLEFMNRGNPCEFDYKFYMENLGIKYYAFIGERDVLGHQIPDKRKLIHKALIIRHRIIEMYSQRGISEERLPLVAAITLGEKSKLEREQKQDFMKAGIMHIMAVSGLHAVILSLFVFNLLFFLKNKFNVVRIVITVLFLWSFAFVTGLTPSVLRATLMFTFLQTGSLMRRRLNGINSVLASAFVLIVIRPSVIFDAGFLLSYSAVIFIIAFYQDFYQKLHFKTLVTKWIWQSSVVTVVAQAGTLSLTIMLFNRFPTWFILTNLIIVPLSSLMIITGCLIPALYPFEVISGLLGRALDSLAGLTALLTAKAASLPASSIENIGMTLPECILLMAVIFTFSSFILKKNFKSVFYPLLFTVLFVMAGTITEILIRTSSELIVYNIQGSSAIGIRTGKFLNIYSDSINISPEISRHAATLGLKTSIDTIGDEFQCLRINGKDILISGDLKRSLINNYAPDIIILTGTKPSVENNIEFKKVPESFIITSASVLPRQLKPAGLENIHIVRKSGGFSRSI